MFCLLALHCPQIADVSETNLDVWQVVSLAHCPSKLPNSDKTSLSAKPDRCYTHPMLISSENELVVPIHFFLVLLPLLFCLHKLFWCYSVKQIAKAFRRNEAYFLRFLRSPVPFHLALFFLCLYFYNPLCLTINSAQACYAV